MRLGNKIHRPAALALPLQCAALNKDFGIACGGPVGDAEVMDNFVIAHFLFCTDALDDLCKNRFPLVIALFRAFRAIFGAPMVRQRSSIYGRCGFGCG